MKRIIDVTIILVVRNNWRQIKMCLDSLLAQPGVATEIVLLNDDSDDGASADIKKFSLQHANVTLFEQKYKGLPVSRNKAIKQIRGSYTLFINQEQQMLPFALQLAFHEAMRTNADVLQMPCVLVGEDMNLNKGKTMRMPRCGECVTGNEYVHRFGGTGRISFLNCANLIRSEFIEDENLRFDYRLSNECDFDFFARAIMAAHRVHVSPMPLCMCKKPLIPNIIKNDETINAFRDEQDIVRKSFNEFAEKNNLSESQIQTLRYLHAMNRLKYGVDALSNAMTAGEYGKWSKAMKQYLMDFGGWKHIGRHYLKMKVEKSSGKFVKPTDNKRKTK